MTQKVHQGFMTFAENIASQGMRPHFVYFLLAEASTDEGRYPSLLKIGTTSDPKTRMKSLQKQVGPDWLGLFGYECADRFDFFGLVVGDYELEQLLHRAFADFKVEGFKEWFWCETEVMETVEMFVDDFGFFPCCDPLPELMVLPDGWSA